MWRRLGLDPLQLVPPGPFEMRSFCVSGVPSPVGGRLVQNPYGGAPAGGCQSVIFEDPASVRTPDPRALPPEGRSWADEATPRPSEEWRGARCDAFSVGARPPVSAGVARTGGRVVPTQFEGALDGGSG